MESRLYRLLLVLVLFVLAVGLYHDFGERCTMPILAQHTPSSAGENMVQGAPHAVLEPANATLGVLKCWYRFPCGPLLMFIFFQFGAIIAVSRQESLRRGGLLLAANITKLDVSIPAQPIWTDQDISDLRAKNVSSITRGSALAWLGHLNALRTFLASDFSTALIIEDDVDWDFRLRTNQIPTTASAFRSLTSNFNVNGLDRNDYWGSTATWDIREQDTCTLT